MQTQNSVLGYRIDLYFHVYKLAIAIDENWKPLKYSSWNKKTKKQWKQEIRRDFNEIGTDKECFDIIKAIHKISSHINHLINWLKKSDR